MSNKRFYYHLKPYLPWHLRIGIRRVLARRKLTRYKDRWPINEAAGQSPEGWSGWPSGKKFALVLTHDVESSVGLAKCRQLMQLEQSLGFRSSFNFIPEGDYSVSAELRAELTRNGFEVGVHDLRHDGKLYQSRKSFAAKARRINHYLAEWGAVGFRSGFMLHNLEWLQDLKVAYDASTFDTDPFEPQPDGVGTIFPFWVPRPDGSGYVEMPYTLPQDSTLFLVLQNESPAIWLQKLDWVAARGGMALLNLHPDYMRFEGESQSARTFSVGYYRTLLQQVKSKYGDACWHVLPRQVAAYVNQIRMDAKVNGIARLVRVNEQFNVSPAAAPALAAAGAQPAGLAPESAGADGNFFPANPVARDEGPARTEQRDSSEKPPSEAARLRFAGKRAAVVLFSHYPADPRPRRAAEALAAQGMTVDMICLRWNQAEPRREKVKGVDILRVPLKRRRNGKLVYFYQYGSFFLISAWLLAFRCVRRRYDMVHVHNMPDFLVFAALVPKMMGAKVILDLHDPMPELMETIYEIPAESRMVRLLKRVEKWSIAFADMVLTPNLAFKNLFSSRSGPAEKIQIVMNSPSEQFFPFRPVSARVPGQRDSERPFVILYHGSLVERHGLDLIVHALKRVRTVIPVAELVICGESTPFFEFVLRLVQKLGLSEAVHYLGMRNRPQIVEAIEACDVGVIPNRRSVFTEINMPTRIFEYLALGRPVIVPRTRGIQDYFGDQDLIYFESGEADELARKIEQVYFQPESTRDIVERGQAIYQRHRWHQENSWFLELTGGLLGSRRR